MSLLKRLTVLQSDADNVPSRKYFHIGKIEEVEGDGECMPMMAWNKDNLSRYVVSSVPSNTWGGGHDGVLMRCLPNLEVDEGEGVFLVTGSGERAHPGGKSKMHFVHLGRPRTRASGKIARVYRLEGVQVGKL